MRVQLAVLLMLVAGCQRSNDVCPGSDPGVGPVPDFACTPQLVGSMVCPGGQIGHGYQCADEGCWRLFADGPCTPPFSVDAGGVDAGPDGGVCPGAVCTQQGDLQCDGSNRLQQCQQGCFVPIGTCDIDGGADGGCSAVRRWAVGCLKVLAMPIAWAPPFARVALGQARDSTARTRGVGTSSSMGPARLRTMAAVLLVVSSGGSLEKKGASPVAATSGLCAAQGVGSISMSALTAGDQSKRSTRSIPP